MSGMLHCKSLKQLALINKYKKSFVSSNMSESKMSEHFRLSATR